ncbi:helix-turn-helix domain-containing protein [Comamonas nitrativorans]|uniref:Helix-turn-helix domain-containing protein n=1 Tax=Comamonas nitrativorans TaxID=108437 RepID=A0ABV9H274_9BURK
MNERIKEERKRLGMSQKVCALYGGVDERTQRKYEQGESTPDVDYLGKLHKFAPGIDVLYILTGGRTPAPAREAHQCFAQYLQTLIKAEQRKGTSNALLLRDLLNIAQKVALKLDD